MRRLIHKPVALAGRQRRSSVPAGLRLPQPRPIGAFVNKPYHFSNSYLISLLLNLTHTTIMTCLAQLEAEGLIAWQTYPRGRLWYRR
jgi:hypothetical protein